MNSRHILSYRMEKIEVHLLKIYSACKGIRIKYFENININNEPMLDRIEAHMPGRFDLQLRLMTFFAAHFEYVLRLQSPQKASIPADSPMPTNISVAINTGARVIIFIDEHEVYRSPPNLRHSKIHNCTSDVLELYNETNPITGETRQTSCCFG